MFAYTYAHKCIHSLTTIYGISILQCVMACKSFHLSVMHRFCISSTHSDECLICVICLTHLRLEALHGNFYVSTTYQLTYVSLICKAIGAAVARAAKAAALFCSSLNIHNQFSQVSWLALA